MTFVIGTVILMFRLKQRIIRKRQFAKVFQQMIVAIAVKIRQNFRVVQSTRFVSILRLFLYVASLEYRR